LSGIAVPSLVNVPALSRVIVAVDPYDVSSVNVVVRLNSQALETIVSDGSSASVVPLDSLGVLASPLSRDNVLVDSEVIVVSRDDISSSVELSDSLSSRVECPPLSSSIWVVILDSQVESVGSEMLSSVEGSVECHSVSDLEFDT